MAQTLCLLRWDGGNHACDLAYGHTGQCSEDGLVRQNISPGASKRVETIAKQKADAEARAKEEEERNKKIDPTTDFKGFLKAYFKVDTLPQFEITLTEKGSTRYSPRLSGLVPPFYSYSHSTYCCGLLEIGYWNGPFTPLQTAIFHYWIDRVRNGVFTKKGGIVATTHSRNGNQAQALAEKLLTDAGFVPTVARNANTNHMMTFWFLKLHKD